MHTIDHCPACNSLDIHKEDAFLSMFVAWVATGEYVWEPLPNHSIICNKCSFIGSSLRLTDKEESALYEGYRGEEYNNKRIFVEPWYRDYLNTFNQEEYNQKRSVGINHLIEKHIDIMTINKVLDYSGNTGIHIPSKFIKAKRYISNSNVPAIPGILKCDINTDKMTVDFLMCGHMLERSSDPNELIKNIKRFINNDSWLYIEVPDEKYAGATYQFHEHLNLWNVKSMTTFLDRHGITIVDSLEVNDFHCFLAKLKII
jgi:hypothetical protein